ncbi:hypothetical protein [Algoriphagus antarcticus]|nr:hypothetical protein [Algoriphagus antarcticus]
MKKLLFGTAFFLGAIFFTSLSVQAEEDIMRWEQMFCTDGSGGTYEICFLTGDGNQCFTWYDTTRDCDPDLIIPTE